MRHGGEPARAERAPRRAACAREHRGDDDSLNACATRPQHGGNVVSRGRDEKPLPPSLNVTSSVGHPLRQVKAKGSQLDSQARIRPDEQRQSPLTAAARERYSPIEGVRRSKGTVNHARSARERAQVVQRAGRAFGIGEE